MRIPDVQSVGTVDDDRWELALVAAVRAIPCGIPANHQLAAIVAIVVEQVNDVELMELAHDRIFAPPFHGFFHSSSPVASSLACTQNNLARLAPLQRQ
jgi:hypothetical protein